MKTDREAALEVEARRGGKTRAGRPIIAVKDKPILSLDILLDRQTSLKVDTYSAIRSINWAEYVRRAVRSSFVGKSGRSRQPPKIVFRSRPKAEPVKGRVTIKVAFRIDLAQQMRCRPRPYWRELARQAIESQLEVLEANEKRMAIRRRQIRQAKERWARKNPGRSFEAAARTRQLLDKQVRIVETEIRRRTLAGSRSAEPTSDDVEMGFAADGRWLYGPLTKVENDLWAEAESEFETWIEAEGLRKAVSELRRRARVRARAGRRRLTEFDRVVRTVGYLLSTKKVTHDPLHPELALRRRVLVLS